MSVTGCPWEFSGKVGRRAQAEPRVTKVVQVFRSDIEGEGVVQRRNFGYVQRSPKVFKWLLSSTGTWGNHLSLGKEPPERIKGDDICFPLQSSALPTELTKGTQVMTSETYKQSKMVPISAWPHCKNSRFMGYWVEYTANSCPYTWNN